MELILENKVPENIELLRSKSMDRADSQSRLDAVDELGKFKCQESKDILWRLMMNDRVYAVQHRAFIKLQAFGEDVKLPRKRKGHQVKDINKKLSSVLKSIGGEYFEENFNKKFKQLYPEEYDIYIQEKGGKFNSWIKNVIQNLPK